MDRQDRLKLVGAHAADAENSGLRRFNQKYRLVAGARGDRQREHAFVHVLVDLLAARAKADLDLRRFRHLERLRRTGVLERQILDVDLLDRELHKRTGIARRWRALGFGHRTTPAKGKTTSLP